jgi:hypothetical protein
MALDVNQLMRHERLAALPLAVQSQLRTILPHFLDNGSIQCRHYGGQQFGWRIRYRVTTPTGQHQQCSLSLGTDGPAYLAAQLLIDLKREELANEAQLQADERTCRAEARQVAAKLKHLHGVFMRHAPGALQIKRLAWEQLDKNQLMTLPSVEHQEFYVRACARQVPRPVRGRPRRRGFGARPPATGRAGKPGLLAQAAGLLWAVKPPEVPPPAV